ncbi:unnamed protein product, partial [marine sediment metagenome]
PFSPYAASKISMEALCHSFWNCYDQNISIVRFFTVYGPAGRPDMSLFRFIKWIMEDKEVQVFGAGEQTRGFTYVSDIVDGIIASVDISGFNVFNLGSENSISINEAIKHIGQRLGKCPRIKHLGAYIMDIPASSADITKAKRVLEWEPKVGINEGLNAMIEWFFQNEQLVREIEID